MMFENASDRNQNINKEVHNGKSQRSQESSEESQWGTEALPELQVRTVFAVRLPQEGLTDLLQLNKLGNAQTSVFSLNL